MPNSSEQKKKKTFKVRPKAPQEKLYKVTLTLSFNRQFNSSDDLEKEERGYNNETNDEFCARVQDWKKTDEAYGTDDKIQRYVKGFDARDFVEYMPPGEVLSAQWLSGFRIAFVFKPESSEYDSVSEIRDWLWKFSLEDGEYESSGDNGWTIKTLKGKMEYGLTDYRDNPILVEQVSTATLSGGKRNKLRQTRKRR